MKYIKTFEGLLDFFKKKKKHVNRPVYNRKQADNYEAYKFPNF